MDRYLIYIELRNQVTPQQIRISWTSCNFGGTRPWIALFPLQSSSGLTVQRTK